MMVMRPACILKMSNTPTHTLVHETRNNECIQYAIDSYLIKISEFFCHLRHSEWIPLPLKKLQYPETPRRRPRACGMKLLLTIVRFLHTDRISYLQMTCN